MDSRQFEAHLCETFLNALYHAFRSAGGPGLPLNNVSLDLVADPSNRTRPVPLGGWYAAWFRLGVCEVYIRVRRDMGRFVGEFGSKSGFMLENVTEHDMVALSRQILRELAAEHEGRTVQRDTVN